MEIMVWIGFVLMIMLLIVFGMLIWLLRNTQKALEEIDIIKHQIEINNEELHHDITDEAMYIKDIYEFLREETDGANKSD